jgi:hypothetical protein
LASRRRPSARRGSHTRGAAPRRHPASPVA